MKKDKIQSLTITLIFSLFIAVIGIATLITAPTKDYLENEKRKTAVMPEFSVEALLDTSYLTALQDYTEDRIFGRSFFVGTNSYLKLAQGRNILSGVYNCRDGYLINAPKALNKENVDSNISNFENFAKAAALPAKMIIVPSPGYTMESVLPAFHGEYCDDYIYSRAEDTFSQIELVDLRSALKTEFENGGGIYYKTDHHLTSEGSYILYQEFMKASGRLSRSRDSFEIESFPDFCGTTRASGGYFLTEGEDIELWHTGENFRLSVSDGKEFKKEQDGFFYLEHLKNDDKYPVYADGNHAVTRIENLGKKGKNLLIIKDSYAHCPANFIACEYENVYMIDLRHYRLEASQFIRDNNIDELLFIYGTDSINTDRNSAWLS